MIKLKLIPTHALFSPKVALALFSACFFLYSLGLSKSISAPNSTTVVYSLLCLFSFSIGLIFSRFSKVRLTLSAPQLGSRGFSKGLWFIFYITLLFYLFEHSIFISKHGSIPLLMQNFEELRFDFGVNGYIHLVAMMGRICLLMIYCDYLSGNGSKSSLRKLVLFGLVTVILDISVGNRGTAVIFIFTLVAATSFYKNFTRHAIAFAAIALVVIGFGKTFREYAMYGDASLSSAGADWAFGSTYVSVSLYHLYMAFAYNISVLDSYISKLTEFGYGYFTFVLPFYSLAPGHQYDVSDLQREVLGIDFHGTLTASMLSTPYFDFGVMGFVIIAVIAAVAGALYRGARTRPNAVTVAAYSYMSLCLFLGVYTYPFDKFYIIMNFIFIMFYYPVARAISGMTK